MLGYRFTDQTVPPELIDEWQTRAGELRSDARAPGVVFQSVLEAARWADGGVLLKIETDDATETVLGQRWRVSRRQRVKASSDVAKSGYGRQCASDVAHLWSPPTSVSSYLSSGTDADSARRSAVTAQLELTRDAAMDHKDRITATFAALAAVFALDDNPRRVLMSGEHAMRALYLASLTARQWADFQNVGQVFGGEIPPSISDTYEARLLTA